MVLSFIAIEKGDIKKKIEALKKTISIILSGEKIPGLLMIIIRFVLPLQDHMIKKLLLIFWEIVPKTTPDGKLLQEMILVCDAYRKVRNVIFIFYLYIQIFFCNLICHIMCYLRIMYNFLCINYR